jgi:cytochrome c
MKSAVLLLGLAIAGAALAQSGAEVVNAKGCLNCHDVDKDKVGPSFRSIAAKRKGDEAAMLAKLKEGKGHPKIAASDAELKAALDHVMAMK